MVRVKIPWGGLTASQLDRLADVAERTPRRTGHVTTRQNVQFHFVPLADVPDLMRSLAEVGLTTREACGNTRSEEHTSELQSRLHLVCRLLLEKKKTTDNAIL